jgi:hypothetical protein
MQPRGASESCVVASSFVADPKQSIYRFPRADIKL